MGTNFYWKSPVCEQCGHSETTHIGKASCGWCFLLHTTMKVRTLEDWEAKWQTGTIEDEYGDTITPERMMVIITEREFTPARPCFDYKSNNAVPGPNGLVRHRIDDLCVKHGHGTYDYGTGEFS